MNIQIKLLYFILGIAITIVSYYSTQIKNNYIPKKKKWLIVILADGNSTRLPDKLHKPINGLSLIEHVCQSIQSVINDVDVVCPIQDEQKRSKLSETIKKYNYKIVKFPSVAKDGKQRHEMTNAFNYALENKYKYLITIDADTVIKGEYLIDIISITNNTLAKFVTFTNVFNSDDVNEKVNCFGFPIKKLEYTTSPIRVFEKSYLRKLIKEDKSNLTLIRDFGLDLKPIENIHLVHRTKDKDNAYTFNINTLEEYEEAKKYYEQ